VDATSTRSYRGASGAERAADRRARLLAAGLDLLGTEGLAATTMTAVCARAGLTERYFYESFPNRDGLLLAVFDEVVEELQRVVLVAVEGAPNDARAKARAAIAAFVELLTDDPRKGRIAVIEAVGSEPIARRRLEALRRFAALIADQAREFYAPPRSADRVVELTAFMLVGGLAETLIAWFDGSLEGTREELIEHCTDLYVATGEAAIRIARGAAAERPS
jgi:AcrR family transcriptional regulator